MKDQQHARMLSDADGWWAEERAVRANTVHGGFELQAAATPHHVALRAGGEAWTYAELDGRASAVAHALRAYGVGSESLVVVCLRRGGDLLVAFLAVLKAGGAYVPLSPDDPSERRRHIAANAQPVVVITDDEHQADFPGSTVLRMDDLTRTALDVGQGERPAHDAGVRPEHLAYVIYTSGSSGRPKGVMCHHRGVANYIDWAARTYATAGPDGAPLFSSVGFDMVVPNIYAPLWSGQAVQLVDDRLDLPSQIEEVVASGPYGFVKLTPGQLDVVTSMINSTTARSFAGLLAVGADLFSVQTLDRWRQLDRTTPMINEYGPTEASVANAYFEIPSDFSGDVIPIGKPIENTSMYVLDGDLRPVPTGATGEIFIGGVCCARGYLGLPAQTSEKFLPDPFAKQPGARMYRTGDSATRDDAGNVVFLGRSDRQLKIRGYRVEPGEVEAVLRRHPDIEDAAVGVGTTQPDAPVVLRAFLVVDGAVPEGLSAWLSKHLPDYAIPRHYDAVEQIPLDANGKVDRAALLRSAEQSTSRPAQPEEHEEAGDGPEAALRTAWCSVLSTSSATPEANFFEMGGDSVAAARLVAALRSAGLELDIVDVFRTPTLSALEPLVRSFETETHVDLDTHGLLPLTPVQQWFADRELEDYHHYNQSILLEWHGEADVDRLEDAMEALVAAHDSLRLRFSRHDEGWRQVVEEAPPGFRLLKEVFLDQPDDPGELHRAATALQSSLDIESGRVLQAALISGVDRPDLLLICAHHLVVDTFSWPAIARDLDIAYSRRGLDSDANLPTDTFVFSQWVAALSAAPSRPAVSSPMDDAGGGPVSLPRSWSTGSNTVADIDTVAVGVDAETTRTLLRESAHDYASPVEVLLLAALAEALHVHGDLDRVDVDVERHGRDARLPGPDRSDAVGWFAGVHRVSLNRDQVAISGTSDAELRRTVHDVRGASAEPVMQRLTCDVDAAPTNPSMIIFNYSGDLQARIDTESFRTRAEVIGDERSTRQERSHDIELEIGVEAGRLTFRWLYSESLHSRSVIEAAAGRCADNLRQLVGRGPQVRDTRVSSDFPLASVSPVELDELLNDVGAVEDVYDLTPVQTGMLLHGLMEGSYAACHVIDCAPGLEPALVAEIWTDVVARHPALRSSAHWEGLDQPVQVVHRAGSVGVALVEWSDCLLDSTSSEETGWLPRVMVARTDEGAARVVVDCHHMWLDGASVDLVVDDATRLLDARSDDGGTVRAPVAYRRFVQWLRDRQSSSAAHDEWVDLLEGSRPCHLGPHVVAGNGGTEEVRVDLTPQTREQLRLLVAEHGVSTAVVVMAAWLTVLSRVAGQGEVTTGCAVDGRTWDLPGVERVVGMVMNTVPVAWRPGSFGSVGDALADLRDRMSRSIAFGYLPLAEIQRMVPGAGGEPFDTVFLVEDVSAEADDRPFRRGPQSREEVHYPLMVTLLVASGGPVGLQLSVRESTIAADAARDLVDDMVRTVALMATGSTHDEAGVLPAAGRSTSS